VDPNGKVSLSFGKMGDRPLITEPIINLGYVRKADSHMPPALLLAGQSLGYDFINVSKTVNAVPKFKMWACGRSETLGVNLKRCRKIKI